MAIDVGDLYRCSFTLKSPDGALVSSTTMGLTVTLPDGTTTVVSPVAPTSAGVYKHDYQTVQAGRHTARWVGTGTNPGAYVEVFDVRAADVPYIISLADAKAQLNSTSAVNDEELRSYVEATTGVVERELGQAVIRRSRTEEHQIGRGALILNWTPVVAVTALSLVDGTYTWDVGDLHVTPAGVVTTPLGVDPYGHVTVTYTAGMAVIPEDYCVAARIIVQHLWQTQRPERGAGLRSSALADSVGVSGMGYLVPNRAKQLLGSGLPGIA